MNFGPCSLFGNPAAANRTAAAVVTLTARSIPTMITRPALFLALAALALPAAAMEVSLEMSARLGTAATAQLLAEEVAHTTDAALADKMSCPMGKVGCPLCYNILERWNADGKLPSHADNHCSDRRPEGVAANVCASRPPPWRLRPARSAVPAARRAAHPPPAARRARRYQTLTGKKFVDLREKTRCVANTAGLKEAVSQGCTLPNCSPEVACSTFC